MPTDSSVNDNDDATISDASSASQVRGDAKIAALLAVSEQRDKVFPKQAHLMVNETSQTQPDVIEWIANGQAFMIHNPKSHKVADVIQKYFNHRKYSSLQRQLNIYGFSKKLDGKFKGAFHHPRFHRSSTDADIAQIRRRAPPRKGKKNKRGGQNVGEPAGFSRNNADASSSSDQLSIYGLSENLDGGAFHNRASTADLALIRRRAPLRRRSNKGDEQNDVEAADFSRNNADASSRVGEQNDSEAADSGNTTDSSSSGDSDDHESQSSDEGTVDEEATETEEEDESIGSSLGGRSTPTGVTSEFPRQVYALVSETAKRDPNIIEWIGDGEAFVIHNPKSRRLGDLLQRYFNHRKYSSLQRQLNLYGFSKHTKGKFAGAFFHQHFTRDFTGPTQLALIKRRPPPSRHSQSKSSSKAKGTRPRKSKRPSSLSFEKHHTDASSLNTQTSKSSSSEDDDDSPDEDETRDDDKKSPAKSKQKKTLKAKDGALVAGGFYTIGSTKQRASNSREAKPPAITRIPAKRRASLPLPTATRRKIKKGGDRHQDTKSTKHSCYGDVSARKSNDFDVETEAFLNTSANLSYSWDALGLGRDLGSAALNRFIAQQTPQGVSAPKLTAQQTLQLVESLRLKTIVPPEESALHRVIHRNRFQTHQLLYGSNDDEEAATFFDPPSPQPGQEAFAAEQVRERQPVGYPFKTLARLYETMCEQDVENGAENRREVQNLSAGAVLDCLVRFENEAVELQQKEEQVMERANELGLVDKVAMNSMMGYHDPEFKSF